jgi:hypothetical protein
MTTTTADPHAIAQATDAFSDAWAAVYIDVAEKLEAEEFHPGIRQNINFSVPNLMVVDEIPIAILGGSRDPIGELAGDCC